MTSFFRCHVFVCTNARRSDERVSCNDRGEGFDALNVLRRAVADAGCAGAGGVRVNQAGCLGRCERGPGLVIYPEGVWYRYRNEDDLREIAEQHLLRNRRVERLLMK